MYKKFGDFRNAIWLSFDLRPYYVIQIKTMHVGDITTDCYFVSDTSFNWARLRRDSIPLLVNIPSDGH